MTHVSIHEIMTSPLTMLHLSKPWPATPQSMPFVSAVKELAPMMNRMKAMATPTRWVRRPKTTVVPRIWKPTVNITVHVSPCWWRGDPCNVPQSLGLPLSHPVRSCGSAECQHTGMHAVATRRLWRRSAHLAVRALIRRCSHTPIWQAKLTSNEGSPDRRRQTDPDPVPVRRRVDGRVAILVVVRH